MQHANIYDAGAPAGLQLPLPQT